MSKNGYDKLWLELEDALGSRPVFHGTVTEIRSQFAAVGQVIGPLFPSPDPSLVVRDVPLESGIGVRVYTPRKLPTTAEPLPIGVYYHGGGFVMGNLEAEDPDCRYLAQHTPCIVVAVDYRHAPECSFNEILKDGLEGYEWAWQNAEKLGGTKASVFPIGASAGGCLSLAVTNNLVLHGLQTKICGVVALCPITAHPESIPKEYQSIYTAYRENAEDVPIINKQVLEVFFEAAKLDPFDVQSFVTLSKCLNDFPRTFIVTCEKDPLRDDGVVLEKMLIAQDVVVKRNHYSEFGHCFWIFPQLSKRNEFLADVVQGIRFVLQE